MPSRKPRTRQGTNWGANWSKLGSGFGDMQRERYLRALRELPREGELIFIGIDAPTSRETGDWRGFTWQEIGELAEGVGRAWEGHDWRGQSASTAPSRPSPSSTCAAPDSRPDSRCDDFHTNDRSAPFFASRLSSALFGMSVSCQSRP